MLASLSPVDAPAAIPIVAGLVTIIGFAIVLRDRWWPKTAASTAPDRDRRKAAEDAAEELTDTRAYIDGLSLGLIQYGRGYFGRPEADEERQRLTKAGEKLDRRKARLAVAFGPTSETAKAFTECADAALEVHRATGAIRDLHSDPPERGNEYAERQVDGYFEEDRVRVEQARSAFGYAAARFEAAAAKATAPSPPA